MKLPKFWERETGRRQDTREMTNQMNKKGKTRRNGIDQSVATLTTFALCEYRTDTVNLAKRKEH